MTSIPEAAAPPPSRRPAALCAVLLGGLWLAACTTPGPAAPGGIAGAWRIEQAQREPILDRRQARIDFGPDGRLAGHTSCNTMHGTYRLQGSTLELGPVTTTRIACARLQLEQEDRILTALEHAVDARVRPDGLLELRDADGRGVLRGTRLDAPAPP